MVVDQEGSANQAVQNVEWISEEERKLVQQLRDRVRHQLPENELAKNDVDQDAFLLRWLRARELSVDKAEKMLLEYLQWRQGSNADKALTEGPDKFMLDTYKWMFVGPDLVGRPMGICPFFEWDFRKAMDANKSGEFDMWINYFFETIMKEISNYNAKRAPTQAPITQFSAVLDCSGYPYGQLLSLGAMKKWFQMACTYEAYYPEVLFHIHFINCPSYFNLFIQLLKPFLCPRTLKKLICYSSVEDWKKEMEKFVDPSILPEQYGGTSKVNPLTSLNKQ